VSGLFVATYHMHHLSDPPKSYVCPIHVYPAIEFVISVIWSSLAVKLFGRRALSFLFGFF
jgi:hypothetical protein